ncbi:MAG: 50S ribosomal protein L10 [Planctomycetota bacterium]
MSKPVKEILMKDYQDRLGDLSDALLVSLRGIDANKNNAIRADLAEKEIRVTVVRNKLFPKAFEGTTLAPLSEIMVGSSALAYGAESVVDVARAFVNLVKENPEVELKGAVLDGELFEGEAGVERLSKFPTREEAIAQNVTLVLSPARNLMGQVKGPGGKLLGIVKSIEEKLEKGEAIGKVG